MFNLIPPLLLLIGLAGLILLLHHQENIISSEEESKTFTTKEKKGKKKWFVNSAQLENAKAKIKHFFEKILIRLRIIVLRMDRILLHSLETLRGKNQLENLEDQEKRKGLFRKNKINLKHSTLDSQLEKMDLREQEKKLLLKMLHDESNFDDLVNLARLYLFEKDFPSARWALIQAYHLEDNNKIIEGLFLELEEKDSSAFPSE